MKKTSFLFLSLFIIVDLHAQWFWQNPLPQGQTLKDEHVFDENTAIAVGEAGTIIKTTDKGISWIAWVFDPEWYPRMFESWDTYKLTPGGEFFKKAMHGIRLQLLPNKGPLIK